MLLSLCLKSKTIKSYNWAPMRHGCYATVIVMSSLYEENIKKCKRNEVFSFLTLV
ncbi:hypothetical protein BgiBS90_020336, partial [Biomphalaria glabrata]